MNAASLRGLLVVAAGAGIVLAAAVVSSSWSDRVEPLQPVSEDPEQIAMTTPLVREGRSLRKLGMAVLMVEPDFNTGMLRRYDRNVELIRDDVLRYLGRRLLVVRVDDAALDHFIERLSNEPGVVSAEKNHVFTSEMRPIPCDGSMVLCR